MAIFYNQATLTYSGGATSSNITVGELVEAATVTKTAVSASYTPGGRVTYVVSIANGGTAPLTGLTVTDDLGGYPFDEETLYPLSYEEGSLLYYVDGVLTEAPAVTAGPPLVITGIDVPAGSNAMLIYETNVTRFAPLGEGAVITNSASVTGGCIADPIIDGETLPVYGAPVLSISKSLDPETVSGCSEVTYTFVVQNTGSAPAEETDQVAITDTFNPRLSGITVTYNGDTLLPENYTYDETTGVFATVPGRITVPAASFVQGDDGGWVSTPGLSTLVVTGTI